MSEIIKLDHPHLPPVHQDFTDWARTQGCTVEKVIQRCLYGQGEYTMDFSRDKAGNKARMQVIPGHLWYGDAHQPTQGPEPSDIMIVGRSVLFSDLQTRRLFSGDYGRVLLDGLLSADFKGEDITKMYLATVLATEPLDYNKAALPADWIKAQAMLLWQQILLVRPKVCLLCGSEAIKAVLGNRYKMTAMEGEVVEQVYNAGSPDEFKVKFVVSISPGAVIHERSRPGEAQKYRTGAEQRMYKQLRHFGAVVRGGRQVSIEQTFQYEVVDDTQQLAKMLERMRKECRNGLVAWDAEWQGDHPQNEGSYLRCIQFAWRTDMAVVIALTHPGGQQRFERIHSDGRVTQDDAIAEMSRMCVEAMEGLRVVGHYFTADLEWLVPIGLDLRPHYDAAESHEQVLTHGGVATELAAHAWDETAKFGLDEQLALHTDFPRYSQPLEDLKKAAKEHETRRYSDEMAPCRAARSELRKARKTLADRSHKYAGSPAPVRRLRLRRWREKVSQAMAQFIHAEAAAAAIQQRHDERVHELGNGYGWIDDKTLYFYAACDASAELELGRVYLSRLTADRYGNDCRKAYWISHRAALVALEINTTGLLLDRSKLDQMATNFTQRRDELLADLRKRLHWPTFNPRSKFQFAEVLFGEEFNGYLQQYGKRERTRPPGALSLHAEPLRTTGKFPMEWTQVREEESVFDVTPRTCKQTLGEMFHRGTELKVRRPLSNGNWAFTKEDHQDLLKLLRNYRFLDQTLKGLVREPREDATGGHESTDDDDLVYDAGVATVVCGDGRVRPKIRQTVETGRWACSKPNLMAISNSRDGDLRRIMRPGQDVSVRTVLKADDRGSEFAGDEDWFLVEADFTGAELLMAAILAQDEVMIDHCRRNNLPDDHPEFLDIHSGITVAGFKLACEPTKKGLESIGKSHLRTAGKSVLFGLMYQRGATAISIALRQDGVFVTARECQGIIDAIFEQYPDLKRFLDRCKARAVNPGWLRNLFGRVRRFPYTSDQRKQAAYSREAVNAPMQGGVADGMSLAARNIYDYRNQHQMRFKISLQIHDAIFLLVPASELLRVIDTEKGVLKQCMIDQVPLVPTDLDGDPIIGAKEQRFGMSIDVYDAWGSHPLPDRLLANSLPPEAVGYKSEGEGRWSRKGRVWSEALQDFEPTVAA